MNIPQTMSDFSQASADCIKISIAQLSEASILARESNNPLIEALATSLGLDGESLVEALGQLMHYPTLNHNQLAALTPDFGVFSYTDAYKFNCLAVRDGHNRVHFVIADPFDTQLQNRIDIASPSHCAIYLASKATIHEFLARHEQSLTAMDSVGSAFISEADNEDAIETLDLHAIEDESNQVVKFVRSTLYDALKSGASDIHMETTPQGLLVKFRIDGVLNEVAALSGAIQADQAISRIKVLAELDIAEHRIPQDGRFKVFALGRPIDLRVSIMPNAFGEDAVLRVLDRKAMTEQSEGLTLQVLGFSDDILRRIRTLAEEPYGMLLVTGPTGSGKTTTLYGLLAETNSGRDKIVTIEDPIEYQLPGVLQIPVNEKKGLTFARGLRSILRHDPDKIMVGEIRDNETAQIAIQSALTGHLVLSTVHANNVFDVIGRFTNMGVDPYSFVSAMNGILAQRLVRLTCNSCKTEEIPTNAILEKSGLDVKACDEYHFMRGLGCNHCHGTGYKGRKAIAEILTFNDSVRELIIAKAPVRLIKEAARESGTITMRKAALDLVKRGETTLEEINRVTSIN